NSAAYNPCSRHQALRAASSIADVAITACSRAAGVQRCAPPLDPLARASARHRSSVATLTPTSRDTSSTEELSGASNPATIRSLYAAPYGAPFSLPCPTCRSYPGGNYCDTGGFPPVKNRVLGRRHAHRDGVSLFGRAAFLRPGRLHRGRRAQPGSTLAAGR